jgi:hypothetical protein
VKKSDREIVEILEAFDAMGVAHSAAPLCDADPKTVRRYVQARDLGRPVTEPAPGAKLIDPFPGKVEEWVERSEGRVRADIVHERLGVMGFTGTERTTRRAVAAAKARWRAGHRRTYRPWITEPGLWLQRDWGKGPVVPGPDGTPRGTLLFCAWLAWSRFRVVLPVWDRTLPTLIACLDAMLRRIGGVPVYALTDYVARHIIGLLCPAALCGWRAACRSWPGRAGGDRCRRAHNGHSEASQVRRVSSDLQIGVVRDPAEVPGGSQARSAASLVLVLISA